METKKQYVKALKASNGLSVEISDKRVLIRAPNIPGFNAIDADIGVIAQAAAMLMRGVSSARFVCFDHGSFEAQPGARQTPSCGRCPRPYLTTTHIALEEEDA